MPYHWDTQGLNITIHGVDSSLYRAMSVHQFRSIYAPRWSVDETVHFLIRVDVTVYNSFSRTLIQNVVFNETSILPLSRDVYVTNLCYIHVGFELFILNKNIALKIPNYISLNVNACFYILFVWEKVNNRYLLQKY